MGIRISLSLLCSAVFVTSLAWGQSSIDETKETSQIYVDVAHGVDTNAGTQSKPFKTLAKGVSTALAQSTKGIGTKVTVLPGTYRESVAASGSGSVPVTIQAATAGTVIVSGADVWTGWQVYSGNSKIYTRSWPNTWGLCATQSGPFEQAIVRRQEMIFVNGSALTQVLSLADMNTGTFFANESNKTVYIWPASGVTVSSATIEVATRPSLLTLQAVNSWVIRDLQFQYANSCRNADSAVWVTQSSKNILIDSDKFVWNNAIGLELTSITDFTVSSSEANHNGQLGMFSQYSTASSWVSDQASYNNWRGAQGAYYNWDSAGLKFGEVHNASVSSLSTLFNLGLGFHMDTDISDITVDSLVSNQNLNSGLVLESNQGPVTVTDAKICGSNSQNQPYEAGVNIVDAAHISVSGSILNGNGTTQILINGRTGGIAVKDFETGATTQVYNQNTSFSTNTIEALTGQQVFLDGFLSQDWSKFQTTLLSDNNTWWNSTNTTPFVVPVPKGHTQETLPGWQSLTGQDKHSSFTNPGSNPTTACETTADQPDFWLTTPTLTTTVTHGGKTSYTFTATSIGFSGTISLKDDVSAASGATASLSTSSIASSGSSVLTVTTSSSTPAGTYPITLIGNSGNITRTVTVSLVVQ